MKSFRKKNSIKKFIVLVFIFVSGVFFQRYGVYGEHIYPLFENYIYKFYEYKLKDLKPLDKIHISITKENYSRFEKSRELAIKFQRNYRTHTDNPGYIDAKLLLKNQEKIPIKFRLTGGRAAHYNNPEKKYSLKIKTNNNDLEFTKFSILNPPVRHFLNEWFFHRFNSYNELISNKFEILSLDEIGFKDEIIENKNTIRENSIEKVKVIKNITGFDCFADDTGLEVDALGGKPGVLSKRFAGINASSEDNIKKLLKLMEN